MTDLVTITCASGKQGTAIIPKLYTQSSRYKLRLVVHSDSSLSRLRQLWPQAEVVQADLNNLKDCSAILAGASVIFYISPTHNPLETVYGVNVIDAAIAESKKPGSKFSHFVFSSVIHTHIRKMLNHDRKRYIEEYLSESPLSWTVLQPNHFMDNTIGRILQLQNSPDPSPVWMHPQNPEISFSFSCVHDFAEAAVRVIEQRSDHFFATYQLVSTWPIKYADYIHSIGNVIGKDIKVKQMTFEESVNLYAKVIFGDVNVDVLYKESPARMLIYYNDRGLMGNPRVTEWLIGRPATSPAALAELLLRDNSKQ